MNFLKEKVAKVYNGFVGVDMFVYSEARDAGCDAQDVEYKINPVVEFNLRMTMGMVARVVYDRCVQKGVRGMFTIDHLPPGQLPGRKILSLRSGCLRNLFFQQWHSSAAAGQSPKTDR